TTLTQNHATTSFTPVTGGGGTSPLSYAVSPPLPTGLSLTSSTGAITGTPTVTSGVTTYTVTVTDANSATASNTFSLAVGSAVT
ncbi:putative Ig domain-containing protein, partial [Acinetobacter baumannii]